MLICGDVLLRCCDHQRRLWCAASGSDQGARVVVWAGNHPKLSHFMPFYAILILKPMILGYPHFRKAPLGLRVLGRFWARHLRKAKRRGAQRLGFHMGPKVKRWIYPCWRMIINPWTEIYMFISMTGDFYTHHANIPICGASWPYHIHTYIHNVGSWLVCAPPSPKLFLDSL